MLIPEEWPTWATLHRGKNIVGDRWLRESLEDDTRTTIHNVNSIKVSHVAHYKHAKGGWRHEFIVVTLLDCSASEGDVASATPLYLRYERIWENDEEDGDDTKKGQAKIGSKRVSSLAIDQAAVKEDIITPLMPAAIDKLKKSKKILLLRYVPPLPPHSLSLRQQVLTIYLPVL